MVGESPCHRNLDLDTMTKIPVKNHDGDRSRWKFELKTFEVELGEKELLMTLPSRMRPRRVECLLEAYEKVLRVFSKIPIQHVPALGIIEEAEYAEDLARWKAGDGRSGQNHDHRIKLNRRF
jgi:hypothetical protein